MKLKQCISALLLIVINFGCNEKVNKNPESKATIDADTLVYDTAPRWSKTKDKILFYTYRHDSEGAELYTINLDKTGLTRITETFHNEWWSDFSPDDNIIYLSSDYGKSERFGGSEIFALKADGELTRLTNHSDSGEFNMDPRVAPDGNQLLYCHDCLGKDKNSEIFLIQTDGTNPINITNHPSMDKYATWSPNGTKVLFESNRSGNFELYGREGATKLLMQLTHNE